jgi:hypothetical protein
LLKVHLTNIIRSFTRGLPGRREASIATGYEVDGRGSILGRGTSSRPTLGTTQPPIQWAPRLFPGVKQPEREADNSTPLYVLIA